jgi:RNA polymerase sigma-70 factor (ECF subfamily)
MNQKKPVPESHTLDPEVWVDQHGDYLYRFALARIKDPSVLGARKNFESRSAVRTWLTAIIKHKIVDYFRKNSKEQAREDIEAIGEAIDSLFDNTGQWISITPDNGRSSPANGMSIL